MRGEAGRKRQAKEPYHQVGRLLVRRRCLGSGFRHALRRAGRRVEIGFLASLASGRGSDPGESSPGWSWRRGRRLLPPPRTCGEKKPRRNSCQTRKREGAPYATAGGRARLLRAPGSRLKPLRAVLLPAAPPSFEGADGRGARRLLALRGRRQVAPRSAAAGKDVSNGTAVVACGGNVCFEHFSAGRRRARPMH